MINFEPLKQSGVGLIEAMLAFFIVGVGMVSLAKLQTQFLKDNADTRVSIAAIHYVQDKIEWLRTSEASESVLVSESHSPDQCDPAAKDSPCQGLNTTLKRTWSSKDCPGGLACRLVTVDVDWVDVKGINQKLSISSYLSGADPVQAGLVLARE